MSNKKGPQHKKLRQEKAIQKKKMQRIMAWTLAIVFLAAVVVVFAIAPSSTPEGETVAATEFHYDKQPTLGAKDAPVQLVEFADFKCPACKQFGETILPQLKKDFIDTGVASLSFINYPIISPETDSRTAAIAAEAVFKQSPDEFWNFYEAVYAKQGDERTLWATPEYLVQIAKEKSLKLDYDKLLKDIQDRTYGQDVRDDEAIGNKVGVHGTPTLYVNGQPVPVKDTFNYSAIKDMIEESKDATQQ